MGGWFSAKAILCLALPHVKMYFERYAFGVSYYNLIIIFLKCSVSQLFIVQGAPDNYIS